MALPGRDSSSLKPQACQKIPQPVPTNILPAKTCSERLRLVPVLIQHPANCWIPFEQNRQICCNTNDRTPRRCEAVVGITGSCAIPMSRRANALRLQKLTPREFVGPAKEGRSRLSTESPQSEPEQGSDAVPEIRVAFWNLQNLFDIESSKLAAELEFTPVNGWDRQAFERKVTNLAEVVRQMFDGQGPDLLGVCELENKRVGEILIKAIGRSDYALAHTEHPDISGLDAALIYSTELFQLDQTVTRGHAVHQRYRTRDIFEVHLTVKSTGAKLVVLVNHWPSRQPSRTETEPYRIAVASHCARLLDAILKLSRKDYLMLQDSVQSLPALNSAWNRNVLIMGDFNDEPWNRSVLEVLGAGFSTERLEEPLRLTRGCLPSYRAYASRAAGLFNPMWSLMNAPECGTCYTAGTSQPMTMRDQIMLSRGLYYGLSGLQTRRSEQDLPQVDIFQPEQMVGRNGRPREFNTETRTGYSDHFPVTTTLQVLPQQHRDAGGT